MKKKYIFVFLALLVALVIIVFVTAVRFWILPGSVVQIELGGYDQIDKEQIVLTKEETGKLIALYSTSWFGGEVNAEPGNDAYWLTVTFKDGSTMNITEGVKNKMIARPQNGDAYYVTNGALISYITHLLEKYDLPTE